MNKNQSLGITADPNAVNMLEIKSVLRSFEFTVDIITNYKKLGIIEDEKASTMYTTFADAFADILSKKYFMLNVEEALDDGTPIDSTIYIFDDIELRNNLVKSSNGELHIISAEEFFEIAQFEWIDFGNYTITYGGALIRCCK